LKNRGESGLKQNSKSKGTRKEGTSFVQKGREDNHELAKFCLCSLLSRGSFLIFCFPPGVFIGGGFPLPWSVRFFPFLDFFSPTCLYFFPRSNPRFFLHGCFSPLPFLFPTVSFFFSFSAPPLHLIFSFPFPPYGGIPWECTPFRNSVPSFSCGPVAAPLFRFILTVFFLFFSLSAALFPRITFHH